MIKFLSFLFVWCIIMSIYWAGKPDNPLKRNVVEIQEKHKNRDDVILLPNNMNIPGGVGVGAGLSAY